MEITLSGNLKNLRHAKGNTQEDLATYLDISFQAISKWERDEAYPDITLLPKLAAYYNVSIDDLLGTGKIREEAKIEEYSKISDGYQRKFDNAANHALWSEAIKEFPNNLIALSGYVGTLGDDRADEIITVSEQIFRESELPSLRYDVIWNLCHLYKRLGKTEKATEYALKAPQLDITKDFLFSFILDGDEAVNHIRGNLSIFCDLLFGQINTMLKKGNFTNEERKLAFSKSLKAFELFFEDEDYGFYSTRISTLYLRLAECDATDKNTGDTLKNLAKATEHGIKFLTQGGFVRTSFLVKSTIHEDGHQGYPNSADNDAREILDAMKQENFDFCREDAAFKAIEAKLAEYAN